jgi:dethiobiotin synthetase
MSGRFVITGTDTGIGKTIFAAGLATALGATYWKPVQAGMDDGGDSANVRALGVQNILTEAYRLKTACAPHVAAAIEGIEIDPDALALPKVEGSLVIEGAGGVLVPLAGEMLFADLFAIWRAPVVLVARTALGTINHSLLSIEALRRRGVEILGVAFVGDPEPESESAILRLGQVQRVGRLPWLDPLDRGTLGAAFAEHIDLAPFR